MKHSVNNRQNIDFIFHCSLCFKTFSLSSVHGQLNSVCSNLTHTFAFSRTSLLLLSICITHYILHELFNKIIIFLYKITYLQLNFQNWTALDSLGGIKFNITELSCSWQRLTFVSSWECVRCSLVVIATRYGLHSPGIKSLELLSRHGEVSLCVGRVVLS
jgi:hypothetical protein